MLLEALEILQSAGEDENTYVTDFALYKVIAILAVYAPFFTATFLLSQEFLGEKIACFAPDNFTDGQAGAVSEYCWNNGFWTADGAPQTKSLYAQPHRFFAFYLAIQAVLCMTPTIIWNVSTKSRLLALMKGTEEFLSDLVELIENGVEDDLPREEIKDKVITQLKRFHKICLGVAIDARLSAVVTVRLFWEAFLYLTLFFMQFLIFDFGSNKEFRCRVDHLSDELIKCTVPTLDLLDSIWKLNVGTLFAAFLLICTFIQGELYAHYGEYQPLFFNTLPFGDEDNFNENVKWESNWVKRSYDLLTMIFKENNTIMTKAYVLSAMKPSTASDAGIENCKRGLAQETDTGAEDTEMTNGKAKAE